MKKSLIALAVAAAVPAIAQAQTNVTMFGIVDASIRYTKLDGTGAGQGTRIEMANSGYNSSRWGVRGTEAIGGGLNGVFWLESSLNNDDSTGFSFNNARRSFVGLQGGFGEVRLGREYTPYFWNHTVYDVFGTNGIGGQNTTTGFSLLSTAVRANNAVTYLLPSGMPVFGQLMYSFGENNSTTPSAAAVPAGTPPAGAAASAATAATHKNNLNAFGARVGAGFGPVEFAVGLGQEIQANNAAGSKKLTDVNVGAKFTFGSMAVMGLVDSSKDNLATANKRDSANIGFQAGFGAGTAKVSFTTTKQKLGSATTANAQQIALGYVHDLSKRTAVYGTVSIVDNKSTYTNRSVRGFDGANGRPVGVAGGKSSGFEFGVRHSF